MLLAQGAGKLEDVTSLLTGRESRIGRFSVQSLCNKKNVFKSGNAYLTVIISSVHSHDLIFDNTVRFLRAYA